MVVTVFPSQDGNTVLHLAAQAGLDGCVELLISKGADLSATNEAKETPADLATRAGYTQLATTMETKIVFEASTHHTLITRHTLHTYHTPHAYHTGR